MIETGRVAAGGPVNCNVVKRRQGGQYPRTCERCKLGPCPFYERTDGQGDGYAENSRYDVQRVESGPPERMGYTSGPGPSVGKRPVQTSDEALRAAFEIALVAAMRDQGITFVKVEPRPEDAPLPSYEHVVEAVQNHINRTLATLRHAPRDNWEAHEAESIRTLKADFDRLGFGHLIDFPR